MVQRAQGADRNAFSIIEGQTGWWRRIKIPATKLSNRHQVATYTSTCTKAYKLNLEGKIIWKLNIETMSHVDIEITSLLSDYLHLTDMIFHNLNLIFFKQLLIIVTTKQLLFYSFQFYIS